MKLFIVCIFLILCIAVNGLPAKAALKPKKTCLKECNDQYKPICAGDGTGKNNKSFGNECVLANYNCENGQNLKIVSQGECPGGGGIRLS